MYEYRKRRLAARAGKIEDDGYEDRSFAYQTIVREVLEAQRREIVRLRNEGTISNERHAPARARARPGGRAPEICGVSFRRGARSRPAR